ncbi:hypothetical protein [Flavobacterium sp. UBA6031]|uniref:hypothetical protein n=1 Tax=Flavobacterium sp. UBA6031 TaxID=1946551 RepID=UPI0025C44797|nr:hypothetical protein [Flavobacterium sp. UBA6031]
MGSPTVNNRLMYATAGLLELIKGLKFTNKKAAAFSCYGWNELAAKKNNTLPRYASFEVLLEPIISYWEPNTDLIEKSIEYGKKFVSMI